MVEALREIGQRMVLADILAELKKEEYKPASLVRFATRAAWRIMGDLEALTVSAYLITVQPDDALKYGVIGVGGLAGAYFADYFIFEQLWPNVDAFDKRLRKLSEGYGAEKTKSAEDVKNNKGDSE